MTIVCDVISGEPQDVALTVQLGKKLACRRQKNGQRKSQQNRLDLWII